MPGFPRANPRWRRMLAACALALVTASALAAQSAKGPMDFLFTTGAVPASEGSRNQPRAWKVAEFSALRLVPRETGAAPNAQPLQANGDALRSALATVQIPSSGDRTQALFAASELAELVPALVSALAAAGPDDDIVLFSTSRRDDGVLSSPMSASARLFVQGGALQLIVRETRADVYGPFRAARVVPAFGFGSRNADSGARLRSSSATSRRGDWLAFDLRSAQGAAPPTLATTPAPIVAPAAAPAPAPATAAAPATAPATATRGPAFFEEQEQRLRNLKRLREQGLISEAEYEEKRREILKTL